MDAAGLSEIATGVEPAHRTRKTETLTGGVCTEKLNPDVVAMKSAKDRI
jgi:hypothetical protein